MSEDEFFEWCQFFRKMLLKDTEDSSFLVEWHDDLRRYSLADAKQGVMEVARTINSFDKHVKLTVGKMLNHIEAIIAKRTAPQTGIRPGVRTLAESMRLPPPAPQNDDEKRHWDLFLLKKKVIKQEEFDAREKQRRKDAKKEAKALIKIHEPPTADKDADAEGDCSDEARSA